MQVEWAWKARNDNGSAKARSYLAEKIPRLERLLARYRTDQRRLEATIFHFAKPPKEWEARLILHLPTGTLVADNMEASPEAALDVAIDQLSVERTRLGGALSQLDRAEERLADRKVDLQTRLSETQDADAIQVFSDLSNQEVALQASLQATTRIIQPTLLDFLR